MRKKCSKYSLINELKVTCININIVIITLDDESVFILTPERERA